LTYGELDAGSNRLAHMLRELGCRRGDRVALLMPTYPQAIMSLIGVLKADAAYVPLDTAGPAPRLARMLEVCGCHSILAAGSAAPILREALARATLAQQPLLGWLDTATPWSGDPPPAFTAADLAGLAATPVESITGDTDPSILYLVAKLYGYRTGDCPDLRRVMMCVEMLPTPTLIHCMRRLPHARFTNLYGPTEATIASSYYTVPRCPAHERDPIPIGTACDGEELMILDDEMRPVRDGEIGNLYIGGVGLSPGYWNDPEKTRSGFLPRPGEAGPDERP